MTLAIKFRGYTVIRMPKTWWFMSCLKIETHINDVTISVLNLDKMLDIGG